MKRELNSGRQRDFSQQICMYVPWGPRITAIPIVSDGEGTVHGLYEGHVNGDTFLDFVNSVLTPCLLPFNGYNPRSIVILGKVYFLADFPTISN